jgi:Domain of unknown function (DUF3784)
MNNTGTLIVFLGLGLLFALIGYAIRFKGKVTWLAGYDARHIVSPKELSIQMGNLFLILGVAWILGGLLSLLSWSSGVIVNALVAIILLFRMLTVSRRYTR